MLAAIFGGEPSPERRPQLRRVRRSRTDDSLERPGSSSSISLSTSPFASTTTLDDVSKADADLEQLNDCLETLAEVFPDVQVEVFREMLSSYSSESRLHVVTEAMLRDPVKWVRGRTRMAATVESSEVAKLEPNAAAAAGAAMAATEDGQDAVKPDERFRSALYKRTVRLQLMKEFKGLSSATIHAVLCEHNYSYSSARPTLFRIASKSWRYSFSSLFRRKTTRTLGIESHPLVMFPLKEPEDGLLAVPKLRLTESHELNKELHDTLIVPLELERTRQQVTRDHEMAEILNHAEAEEHSELYDCECCFTDGVLENMVACSSGTHLACHNCVRHAVREALFGQGWARSVIPERGSIRCLAAGEGCIDAVPVDLLRRAVEGQQDGGGALIWEKFESRLANDNLGKTEDIKLVRCPFCTYAEVDDTEAEKETRASSFDTLRSMLFRVMLGPLLLIILSLLFLSSLINSEPEPLSSFSTNLEASRQRIQRRRQPLRFKCRSPSCLKSSCLSCFKLWRDPHECYDSLLTSYRTTVDQALSNALKRTCPRCHTSFIKSSGCNKLTCPCGYKMCYLCRADITPEGYKHFCAHFRDQPGTSCTQCDKCDLYKAEDEELVLRKARDRAEQEWQAKKKDELGNISGGISMSEVKKRNEEQNRDYSLGTRDRDRFRMMGKGAKFSDMDAGFSAYVWCTEGLLEEWLDWILTVTG